MPDFMCFVILGCSTVIYEKDVLFLRYRLLSVYFFYSTFSYNASEIWAQLTKNHLTKSSTERFRDMECGNLLDSMDFAKTNSNCPSSIYVAFMTSAMVI